MEQRGEPPDRLEGGRNEAERGQGGANLTAHGWGGIVNGVVTTARQGPWQWQNDSQRFVRESTNRRPGDEGGAALRTARQARKRKGPRLGQGRAGEPSRAWIR